jgi:hypothetical protein
VFNASPSISAFSALENVAEVRNFSSHGLCLRFRRAEGAALAGVCLTAELQVNYSWGAVRATPVWVSESDGLIDVGFSLSVGVGELEAPFSVTKT